MKTGTLRVAMATAFLALGAASLKAETPGTTNEPLEIRVVNNYTSVVRVYVQDVFGRLRSIGRVERSDAKVLTVPEGMTDRGAVEIKIYSDEPIWSPLAAPDGIRTMPLNLKAGDVVNFWVETAMADSYLQIIRS